MIKKIRTKASVNILVPTVIILLTDQWIGFFYRKNGECSVVDTIKRAYELPFVEIFLILMSLIFLLRSVRKKETDIHEKMPKYGVYMVLLGCASSLVEYMIFGANCDNFSIFGNFMFDGTDIIVTLGIIVLLWNIIFVELNLATFRSNRKR